MTAFTGSRRTLIAGGAIALAAALAYGNSLSGVFTLDDGPSILDNGSIRHLWPLGPVLAPAHGGMTVSGRPLVNLSLAVNYALGGLQPAGYHLFNLIVHILAGLALWGVVGRTLARVGKPSAPGGDGLALAIALLWTLHPLQTESVTYVVQRAEAMMGMFYLLTLYCFIRHAEELGGKAGPLAPPRTSGGPGGASGPALPAQARAILSPAQAWAILPSAQAWAILSVICCLFGMACKEIMVSAPVIVFLYDRTFVSGSFRAAWRQRRRFYLGLAGTWILLAWLVTQSGNRGGTSGWGTGVSPGRYWLTQFPAIMRYLKLSFWPQPLIFDYGMSSVRSAGAALFSILAVLLLAGASAYLLIRRKAAGFLGACFFAVLAPTSLMPGNRQVMAEHRMYLALAPVMIVAAMALARAGRRRPRLAVLLLFALAVPLGLLTHRRNRDYRSELALYGDTVAKLPSNNFAQVAYGLALADAGRVEEAIPHYRTALQLNPGFSEAYNDMGLALYRLGRMPEAIAYYERAVRLNPMDATAHNDLGVALYHAGGRGEALAQYREALRLKPEYPEAWDNLGNLWRQEGKTDEAIAAYEHALRISPDYSVGANNLGVALAAAGRLSEAIVRFRQAVEAKSDYPEAQNNLGLALIQAGKSAEAVPCLRAALRLKPDYANAHYNLGLALRSLGRNEESSAEFDSAARLR